MSSENPKPQQQATLQRLERAPLPFVPGDMEQAWRTSELLSKASLLPDALKGKPHDVLVAVLTGAELGISPMQALREVYVVKGKPFIASLLRVAIVRQSPECLSWQLVESTDKKATYRTQRRGDATPTTMSYTIEEATSSGLLAQNAKYKTDPALMLRRRCAGRLIDEVYPDVIRGVGDRDTDAEEFLDGAQAAAQKAEVRAVVKPPHLREKPQEPVVEGEVVEPKAESKAEPEQTPPVETQSSNGEPSVVDLLALALHEAQTDADVTAAGKRIKAARQTGQITEEERQDLGKLFTQRQREVRQ